MKEAPPPGDFFVPLHGLSPEETVARLIDFAADLMASDLFLQTNENHVAVSIRHLGIYRLLAVLPSDLGRRSMAHIKALAGLDIAERRRPMDGRWIRERPDKGKLDLRINVIPTLYGEDFTLRLLGRTTKLLNLQELGLLPREENILIDLLHSPSGLILVTGPTGAGKTTTLYACLNHLNNGQRKINTIEDPVEYAVEGIRQSQVNVHLGVDFPELLRNVLRQAPDVIMVGEIRDPVTAETAVRAANSGHLVLATLHAPISAGAVQSMLALGVHPHFLGTSLRGVVAQRLLRTLCPRCKTFFDVGDLPAMFQEVRAALAPGEGTRLFAARGCPECHMSGYADRTGVFEILPVTGDIRKMILDRQPTAPLRQKAIDQGMMEFRQAALLKVARGDSSAEEVIRVIPTEYLGLEE